ncbi:NUDIX hydrolase [Nostoc sp. CHAB 5844]|nr:NUDIX hydrolase [Nostoc sp. CHAB 5844]
MDIDRLTKRTQFSKTDRILDHKISDKNITFEYQISAKPNYQWWVLYRGVLPDGSDLKDKKEKQPDKKKEYWDWVPKENKEEPPIKYDIKAEDEGKKGTVSYDYKFRPNVIYTLALFKDETENAHDLADYVEFRVPPEDDKLSNLKISENTITFDYQISAEYHYWQWWVLYRGVMRNDNLNENKEYWRWVTSNETEIKDYDFKPGAIYTLALFKNEFENAHDLADYYTFCVPLEDNTLKNTLSNLKTSENTITFDYQISADPDNQWWVLYRGVMPPWDNLNKNIEEEKDWRKVSKDEGKEGTVNFNYKFTPGVIYTLALFKDEKEDAYDLADYIEFSVSTPWTVLVGENSYCYCACNSTADNKQEHNSSHTMNVEEGAPYFYAVLTKDDDTVDFPDGAVLTIEDPDGTKYDRNIEEENQLVIMSGSSVRCLIVKDPKPGDWKMKMTAPEGLGFHCECNTVPSKDVYDTIIETLDNSLQKRDLGTDGWFGITEIGSILIPDLLGKPSPLFMTNALDANSYVAVGESGDKAKIELSQDNKLEFEKGLRQSANFNSKEGGATEASQKTKNIAETSTKKNKGKIKYVYAVAHDMQGNFIIAKKNILGYFFHEKGHDDIGDIYPDGRRLNGRGKNAFPGGEMEEGSAFLAAYREFFEETNINMSDFTVSIEPFEGHDEIKNSKVIYYGVYFYFDTEKLRRLLTRVNQNLEAGKIAADEVRDRRYRKEDYMGLRRDFPDSPIDNELEYAEQWNLEDRWQTITRWRNDDDLNWFYKILTNLRSQLRVRVRS